MQQFEVKMPEIVLFNEDDDGGRKQRLKIVYYTLREYGENFYIIVFKEERFWKSRNRQATILDTT